MHTVALVGINGSIDWFCLPAFDSPSIFGAILDVLDASNLMMPLVFFVSSNDPRMLKTLDATIKSPEEGGLVSNSLTFRYDVSQSPDGLSGKEGTFNICSFWLVEALTRGGRSDPARVDEARLMSEKMLGYANHLGLFAEETGPLGEALGNFPQASPISRLSAQRSTWIER